MRKIVALCNTYSQLMCILQLRLTILREDNMTLVMSDHSLKSEDVCNRIKYENLFNNVIYWKSRTIDYTSKKGVYALKIIGNGVMGSQLCIDLEGKECDLFMYYNYGVSESILFSQLYKNNNRIRCARFEEGVSSYNHKINTPNNSAMPQKLKYILKLRHLIGKPEVYDRTDTFYCYYPKLYNGNLKTEKIPLISKDDEDLRSIIRRIFNISDSDLSYPQKYIFFGCVGDFEGGEPIGETEVAIKIADAVGRDNFLVKVHPRDRTNSYEEAGLQIDNNSTIPWEAIQLCKDFSDHIFISTISSSVLTGNMIVENPARVFFTYPLCKCDNNSVARDAIKAVENVLNMCREELKYVKVVESIEDIGKKNKQRTYW